MIRNLYFTSNSDNKFTFFRMHPEGINKDGKKWRHEEGFFSSNILICLIKNMRHHFILKWLSWCMTYTWLCLAYIGSVLMFRQLLKQNNIFLEDYELDDIDLKFVEVSNYTSHCHFLRWYFVLICQWEPTYVIWLCAYTKFCHMKFSPH